MIKNGLTNSIGWNLGKKYKSIHRLALLTSTPITGTNTKKNMNDLNSYLFSMNVEDLKNTVDLIRDIIESKIKSSLKVNDDVYIVQKTKKSSGVITKIMRSKCLVRQNSNNTVYRVPMSMIQKKVS